MADTTVDRTTSTIEEIDPVEAREMLGLNTHNRPINANFVRSMADAMKRGDWAINGDAIRVSTEGILLDGQHRLHAVIAAGVPIETVVIRGLRPESQETMDLGRRRSFADMLALRGEKNATTVAGAIKWDIRLRTDTPRSNDATVGVTPQVGFRHLDKHPGLRDAAHRATQLRRVLHVSPSLFAALIYEFRLRDEEDSEAFFMAVQTGIDLTEGDPRLLLRRLLIREQTSINRIQIWRIAAMTIKAWNAFRDGETIQLLAFKVGGANPERWPEIR